MMINYDKYYFCENRITDLAGDGKTYNFINERTTYQKHRDLFAYVIEVCDKLDMKILKTLAVSEVRKKNYQFYNLKDMKSHSGTFHKDVAVALTYNGFINAVLWVSDFEGQQTYFYNTDSAMLTKGVWNVLRSKNLRPMIRKIVDKGQPVTDYQIINGVTTNSYTGTPHNANGSNNHDCEDLYRAVRRSISNEVSILREANDIRLSGNPLRKALELAIGDDTHTPYETDNSVLNELKDTLDKYKEIDKKLEVSRSAIKDALTSPTYMVLTNFLCDDDECVIVKCTPEDDTRYVINSVQYCSDINDYRENESLLGIINMYKTLHEKDIINAGELQRINKSFTVDSYSTPIDGYDESTKVGAFNLKQRKRSSCDTCKYTGLYLVDMQ